MDFRIVTRKLHALIDYPVAISLMAMPFLLGLGESSPFAFWLSFVTGAAAFGLTLLTQHETGVVKVLPYKIHLAVDFIVGVVFLAAPLLLGFHRVTNSDRRPSSWEACSRFGRCVG